MTRTHITGSFQLMKSLNRSVILTIIREYGPISRADIAKQTKLTPPTVTNIVSELLESGIVKESAIGKSKGGRKPILLTIEAKHSYIIGIDVGGRSIRAVLTDLDATIEHQVTHALPKGMNEQTFLKVLKEVITDVLSHSSCPEEKIIGIGVGMHGIVDHTNGIALYAPNFNLANIPIKQELEGHFEITTYVENDARALALGESWFGNGKDIDHVLCMNVGTGIGAGIILNNELFYGHHGTAGEIGHTVVDMYGKRCQCGSDGCLQTIASSEALQQRALEALESGRTSILMKNNLSGKVIHECAMAGDELAIELLEETGTYLGIGIINSIHFMNPEKVIIGGGVSKAGDFILEPLKKVVQTKALTEQARNTEIVLSHLGDNGTVIGAVTIVLKQIFSRNSAVS
ncbi:ROK family transcriptional regulator [Halalkalibacter sp. APA_J-10(15)]|uniref:ROK family transcriptional regulator n=1 Tax=Halalkalibacter sp. APA_J-10(15) TaxID=2933805 RepID=UPI001FF4BBF3|nr:ROK family transcriptional regulator [Halalkalibacter sp. APA_J-10(15)]MCK0470331.1 ROK family transcriptional regulator [Halalkalibacter sp. APA_J-10(15)]